MREFRNYIQKCPECGNWGEDVFEIENRTFFNPITKCKRCGKIFKKHHSTYSKLITIEAKDRKTTPEEFKKEMKSIFNIWRSDEESAHKHMDILMCELLRTLGYEDGIKIFKEQDKWYS